MGMKIKRLLFQYYVFLLFLVFLGLIAIFVVDSRARDNPYLSIAAFGGLVSAYFLIQKQQLDELNLFKNLFTNFNGRYDKLHETLNEIAQGDEGTPLTTDQINALNTYFNLCGEEYLYYILGYIYPNVWRAWGNGMKSFLQHKRIRDKWLEEELSDSYYGLTLSTIEYKRDGST